MAMTHAAGGTTAPGRGEARALIEGSGWLLIVLMWALLTGMSAFNAFPTVIDQLSTDDAMRLVEVRDLLAGQSWWDLTQYRLNPPDGIVMHWSRVIDLPMALMLAGFRHVFAEEMAVKLTITLWPALLLLPTLLACASVSRALAGPTAAVLGAFMMVMSPGVTGRFAPAAIDHHGAQIALALTLLACSLKIERSVFAAIGGGLCAAVMMAIGMETAPHVAACAGVIALRWALSKDRGIDAGVIAFGLTFAIATFVGAALTLAPGSWLAPVCDTLGVGHIVVAAIGGIGLTGAACLRPRAVAGRLVALGLIGAAVVAGLLVSAPNCVSSPYGFLPEKLQTDWLSRVLEAQPFFVSAADDPSSGLAIGLPLLALIAVAIWATIRAKPEQRWSVGTSALMCAAAVAVTLWQIRGASLAFALGGPLLPVAVLTIGRNERVRTLLALVVLSPATISLVGLGAANAAGFEPAESTGSAKLCKSYDYAGFARLPKGVVLNTIDTGPAILAFTPHSVVAAPYHRNVDGLMAEITAFEGSQETARAIALSRRASYVAICPGDGDVGPYARNFPDSFAAQLLGGKTPNWLEPVNLGAGVGLRVFRVVAGR